MHLRPLREDELPDVLARQRAEYRRQLVEWAGMRGELRGRGYGRAAIEALEQEACSRGVPAIEFNVWGGNAVASSLYRSLGYTERSVLMGKDLQC